MRWIAFGTGVGIEWRHGRMDVAIVKVRPSAMEVLAETTIANPPERPAAEWGAEYASFLRSHGAAHLAATAVLPRRNFTLRTLALPGVAAKDLEPALRLQIDTLHPYPEDDVAWSWTRLPGSAGNTTPQVLVVMARRSALDRHIERLAEAGIKVASLTCAAALLPGVVRLYGQPPAEGFVAWCDAGDGGIEVYGESPSKPFYSSVYDTGWERALVRAASELRLASSFTPREFAALLPSPRRTPGEAADGEAGSIAPRVAAIGAAVPRLLPSINLLPEALRSSSSRLIYAPTAALGLLLVLGLIALAFYGRYEDARYLELLRAETAVLEPRVRYLQQLDERIARAQANVRLLDSVQARTKSDLDALRELTRLVPPPGWAHTLELTRSSVVVAGEADQASGLLRALDSSPLFANSEFLVPLSRVGNAEIFRIRAARELAEGQAAP